MLNHRFTMPNHNDSDIARPMQRIFTVSPNKCDSMRSY